MSVEAKVVYQFTWPSVLAALARSAADMVLKFALDALLLLLPVEELPQAATLAARPRAASGTTARQAVRVLIRCPSCQRLRPSEPLIAPMLCASLFDEYGTMVRPFVNA